MGGCGGTACGPVAGKALVGRLGGDENWPEMGLRGGAALGIGGGVGKGGVLENGGGVGGGGGGGV